MSICTSCGFEQSPQAKILLSVRRSVAPAQSRPPLRDLRSRRAVRQSVCEQCGGAVTTIYWTFHECTLCGVSCGSDTTGQTTE